MLNRYERFSFLISSINRDIQKIEREEMVKYGYKGAYAQYLIALYRNPYGLTSAQLCEICDKDKAAVSRVVSEMVEKNLVKRTGDNIYRAMLVLTDEGKKAVSYVAQKAEIAVDIIGNSIEEDERKIMYEVLKDIYTKLNTISQTGIPDECKGE